MAIIVSNGTFTYSRTSTKLIPDNKTVTACTAITNAIRQFVSLDCITRAVQFASAILPAWQFVAVGPATSSKACYILFIDFLPACFSATKYACRRNCRQQYDGSRFNIINNIYIYYRIIYSDYLPINKINKLWLARLKGLICDAC